MTVHLTEQECLEIARKWSNSRFVASAERFLVDYARELLVANEEKQAAQAQAKLDPDASYAEHLAENCTFGVAAQAQAAHPSYDKDCCHGHKDDCKCVRFDAQAAVEPVAWMFKEATYAEGDVRGRGWKFHQFSMSKPDRPWMQKDVTPLYTSPPDHLAEIEMLRSAIDAHKEAQRAALDNFVKLQKAMQLALDVMARYQRKRDDWDTFADAIAALEKELT